LHKSTKLEAIWKKHKIYFVQTLGQQESGNRDWTLGLFPEGNEQGRQAEPSDSPNGKN
jgi:hypothetical protein